MRWLNSFEYSRTNARLKFSVRFSSRTSVCHNHPREFDHLDSNESFMSSSQTGFSFCLDAKRNKSSRNKTKFPRALCGLRGYATRILAYSAPNTRTVVFGATTNSPQRRPTFCFGPLRTFRLWFYLT